MEENSQELQPDKITLQISISLTKQYGNYNEALNQARNASVTEENILQAQQFLRNINSFLKAVDDHREKMKRPYFEAGKAIDTAHKAFGKQFEEAKVALQAKVNTVAQEKIKRLEAEKQKLQKEASIKQAVNDFVLDYAVKIASATTNEQLLAYERLINLEKANKSKYADLLPLLIERCNDLNSKIAEQKLLVKEKEKIEAEKNLALSKENDEKAQMLAQKEQEIADKIRENTIRVQEQASEAVFSNSDVGEVVESAPKARYTAWKAEIFNEKEAIKKASDLLKISLDPDKVKTSINLLKDTGVLDGKTEYVLNGIRYFVNQTF